MTEQVEGQMSMFDPGTWCGRMFPEHCQAPEPKMERTTREKTSRPSSRKSSGSSTRMLPMFLYLTSGNGENQEALWDTEKTDARFPSPGDYMTLSFGERPSTLTGECSFPERPNGVSESRLSQILEDSAHPKYYLSAKACAGILNRATKRGKQLPEILKTALENQIEKENSVMHSEN